MKSTPVIIPASQAFDLKSKIVRRTYHISVVLPMALWKTPDPSWPFNNPLKKYPVVYLLDPQNYFGMVTEMTRSMAWCGSTTDAIVVGIGYFPSKDPAEAWRGGIVGRQYNFTPERDETLEKEDFEWLKRKVPTGGAPKFLQFIRQELLPHIEKKFPADPKKRILAGHSLGGMFAAYALFEEPGLFDTYVVCSPSFWINDKFVIKQEERFAKRHKRLPAKVYLSVGEMEETLKAGLTANVIDFCAQFESRNYKGLTLTKQLFNGLNHCEVIAPSFQTGLKFALKRT